MFVRRVADILPMGRQNPDFETRRTTVKKLVGLFAATRIMLLAAGPFENAVLHGETDKACAIDYAPGEEMVFTLSLQGAGTFAPDEFYVEWSRIGDDGLAENGKVDAKSLPLVIKTKLEQPGFVRILACVVDKKGNECKKHFSGDFTTPEGRKALNAFERTDRRIFFDGGAGVRVDELRSVPEPVDFDEFWTKRKARLAKVPMVATVKEQKSNNPTLRILTFSVLCAGPRPVTGWVTIPTETTKKYPALISFHGYGSHFVQPIPHDGPTDKIHMYINAHGYELGREDEYYTELYNSIKSNGKTFGLDSDWQNKSTDTAYFGWMIYRIARALQYLKSFPEWDGKNLRASGGSMGGLQAIWAAGIDSDVNEATPEIPWCCDMGGRESLKRMRPDWGVGETEAMRYFDPVNFAKRISPKCRVEITRAGLGDYCCPPSGIAVFYNNLNCPKKINWVQGATHGYVPKERHQTFSLTSNWD